MKRATKGKSLESLILASQGEVLLTKVPNGVKYIGGGKTVPTRGPVDFVGVVAATGQAVFIDAKECDLVHRFPVGNKDHFAPHQREQLIRYGRAGAVAGLLIEATRHGRLYWMPWTMLLADVPSVPWDELVDLGPSAAAVHWRRLVRPAAVAELEALFAGGRA